jgi:hypothetical protein
MAPNRSLYALNSWGHCTSSFFLRESFGRVKMVMLENDSPERRKINYEVKAKLGKNS